MDKLLDGLRAVERASVTALGSHKDAIENLTDRVEIIESKGDRPRGTRAPSDMKAFSVFARTGETKEMSIGGGAAAGQALVPEIISDEILNRALAQSRLASIVRRTMVDSSDYVRLVNMRGQSASWASETGSRSETANLELRERRPTHGELYSVVVVANWLLQDSKFNVAEMIVQNAADQFSKSLEAAILSGNGSNAPTGLLNTATVTTSDSASPQRAAAALQHIVSAGNAAEDVISLFFALKPEYRARASFVMSSGVLSHIRKLRGDGGTGEFLWSHNLSSSIDAPDGLLLGRPVITSEELSATFASSPQGRKILCGDFQSGYELVQMGGMEVLRDPYSTKGKTAFYISQRFGGCVTDNSAIRVLVA